MGAQPLSVHSQWSEFQATADDREIRGGFVPCPATKNPTKELSLSRRGERSSLNKCARSSSLSRRNEMEKQQQPCARLPFSINPSTSYSHPLFVALYRARVGLEFQLIIMEPPVAPRMLNPFYCFKPILPRCQTSIPHSGEIRDECKFGLEFLSNVGEEERRGEKWPACQLLKNGVGTFVECILKRIHKYRRSNIHLFFVVAVILVALFWRKANK